MNTKFLIAAFTTVGIAAGSVAGYMIGVKRSMEFFNEELAAQVAKETEHLRVMYKRGEDSTPEAVVQRRIKKIPTGISDDPKYDRPTEVSRELLERVVTGLKYSTIADKTIPTADAPYLITYEEFESANGYDQVNLTYFMADETLADEDDDILTLDVVGANNLDQFQSMGIAEAAIYVRDTRIMTDYEVVRSNGSYAEEVAGEAPKQGPREGRFPEE